MGRRSCLSGLIPLGQSRRSRRSRPTMLVAAPQTVVRALVASYAATTGRAAALPRSRAPAVHRRPPAAPAPGTDVPHQPRLVNCRNAYRNRRPKRDGPLCSAHAAQLVGGLAWEVIKDDRPAITR
jgi:hypothetical protein